MQHHYLRPEKLPFRDNGEHRGRVLAHGPRDITQRLASRATLPEFSLLVRRQASRAVRAIVGPFKTSQTKDVASTDQPH